MLRSPEVETSSIFRKQVRTSRIFQIKMKFLLGRKKLESPVVHSFSPLQTTEGALEGRNAPSSLENNFRKTIYYFLDS